MKRGNLNRSSHDIARNFEAARNTLPYTCIYITLKAICYLVDDEVI